MANQATAGADRRPWGKARLSLHRRHEGSGDHGAIEEQHEDTGRGE